MSPTAPTKEYTRLLEMNFAICQLLEELNRDFQISQITSPRIASYYVTSSEWKQGYLQARTNNQATYPLADEKTLREIWWNQDLYPCLQTNMGNLSATLDKQQNLQTWLILFDDYFWPEPRLSYSKLAFEALKGFGKGFFYGLGFSALIGTAIGVCVGLIALAITAASPAMPLLTLSAFLLTTVNLTLIIGAPIGIISGLANSIRKTITSYYDQTRTFQEKEQAKIPFAAAIQEKLRSIKELVTNILNPNSNRRIYQQLNIDPTSSVPSAPLLYYQQPSSTYPTLSSQQSPQPTFTIPSSDGTVSDYRNSLNR